MKFLIPWVGFALSLIASAYFYKNQKELAVALAKVESQAQQAGDNQEPAASEMAQIAQTELTRLRNENAEIHRLRNEVRQLKTGGAGLPRNVMFTASAVPASELGISQAPENPQVVKEELETLKKQVSDVRTEVCGQNLSAIIMAINHWAGVKDARAGENVLIQNILPYLKNNTFPLCPAGGNYTIRPYGMPPQCSVPGHIPAQ